MKLTKARLIFIVKLLVMVLVFGFVGDKLLDAWHKAGSKPVDIDWRYIPIIPLGFIGIMITNSLTWLWLARQMGDRSPTVPLLGAYTFSQAGKYAPGKIFLVLMRIDRTHRAGMPRELCVLSTILENAMYTLSGALVGAIALLVDARDHPLYLVLVGAAIAALLAVFHPKIFFFMINMALKSMKRGPIPPSRQFRIRHMLSAVGMFMPVWFLGGLALWASVHSIHAISLHAYPDLVGTFALSVSLGMFSLLPGGLGVREAIQALFLTPIVGSPELIVVAVAMPRVAQIVVEMTLAGIGGVVNARMTRRNAGAQQPQVPMDSATQ